MRILMNDNALADFLLSRRGVVLAGGKMPARYAQGQRGPLSMRRMLLALLISHLPRMASADALENAYFVCDVFKKTGVSTECRASNATSTVDLIIDTDDAEARKVCAVIANNMAQNKRWFGGQWQLRIFAPNRADVPLAACALR
jgi:hypothetical protein